MKIIGKDYKDQVTVKQALENEQYTDRRRLHTIEDPDEREQLKEVISSRRKRLFAIEKWLYNYWTN